MQRPIFWFLSAILLFSASLPLAAQKFLPKNIVFKGVPEYSDEELMKAAGLNKGVTLSVDEMKGHFQQLMDTGLFETVSYKFDGVDLTYTLAPAALLYPLKVGNLPLVAGKDLDAKLHDRLPLFHGKVPSEGGMLDGVRGALEEMLGAQGIKASVIAIPFGTPGTKDVTAMDFSIQSPPVRVGNIQVEGVSPAMETKVTNVAAHAAGAAFDSGTSQTNLEHIFASFYQENGYAAVKVGASRSENLTITPDAISVPFSVVVQEGRVYKLGSINLPPGGVVTQADFAKVITANSDGIASGLTLRSIWSLISSRYKSKGYLDCVVTPHPELDDAAGIVNYTVDVNTGPVYHMALVKFDNVSDDLRKLLMRNWQLFPGDPFDPSYLSNFVASSQKADPALARTLAMVKVTYDVKADPQTHDVNVVVRFEKRQ
ncbi:MAG: POTRA domain-containing protein [Terracidiphilus sp.]|jgi:outer membrane protein insertion porin family